MAIFKITRLGMSSIAVLVALLWGCFFAERALLRQARMDNYRAIRQMQRLKLMRQAEPVSHPLPFPGPGSRRAIG